MQAIVDYGASAPVIGMHLARKLGIWKRARKVKVKQGDGSSLDGKFVANASFKAYDSSSVLCRFLLDAEVLEIGNRDVILGLSWLVENGFSVDTQDRCLRNATTGQVIPCAVRYIPSILLLNLEEEPLEDGEILLIIDASESRGCRLFGLAKTCAIRLWRSEDFINRPRWKQPGRELEGSGL